VHHHPFSGLTGPIANIGNAPINGVRYTVKDDNAGWRSNEGGGAHHIEVGGGDNDEGQHYHSLPTQTGDTPAFNTLNTGDHVHDVDAVVHVPSYVAARFSSCESASVRARLEP